MERARARALAGVGPGAASTGALITDVREVDEGVPVPSTEPKDTREDTRARPAPTRRPAGGRPPQGKRPGGRS